MGVKGVAVSKREALIDEYRRIASRLAVRRLTQAQYRAHARKGFGRKAYQRVFGGFGHFSDESVEGTEGRGVDVIPEGHLVKGVSTYVDTPHGKQWVKTDREKQTRAKLLQHLVETIPQLVDQYAPFVPAPSLCSDADDMLAVVPIGDPHFGMLSWAKETGENYDIKIAERVHTDALRMIFSQTPATGQLLLVSMGDLLHYDNDLQVTPRSGHPLDGDSRHFKVVGIAIRTFCHAIHMALHVHKHVHMEFLPGNHDPHSSHAVSFAVREHFRDNPRVTVHVNPSPYRYHRFGANLLGFGHGDKAKANRFPLMMATRRAEDWGQTTERVFFMGHVHHESEVTDKEHSGCVVRTVRTLAPKDAYADGGAYDSGRDVTRWVYHRELGEVSRTRISAKMASRRVEVSE